MDALQSGIWLYMTVLFAIALFFLGLYRARRMEKREQELLGIAVVAGAMLFAYEHTGDLNLLLLCVGIANFNGLLSDKSPKMRIGYVIVSAAYITAIHWIGFQLIAQAMLLGILSVITKLKQYRNRIENRRVELRRDVFHMGAGVFLMLMFMFESEPVAVTALMLMILGGILAICIAEISKDNPISNVVVGLERGGAALGYGALWLALGSLFAVSFLNTTNVLVVFAAIFIGDPVATIIGIHFNKIKLPWNRRKSVAGTASYFLAATIISFFLIGYYALLIGLVGAVIESLRIKVDDNFSVSVLLTALLLILGI